MWLVAGLGNPGPRYEATRHNLGFWVVDRLAEPGSRWEVRDESLVLRAEWGGDPVWLAKPQTFMNRSGAAVASLAHRLALEAERVVVVVDDVALEPHRIRVRADGSHGGHNGLRSIAEALGTDGYPRVRVGVGGATDADDLVAHVLSSWPEDDMMRLRSTVERAAEAVRCVVAEGVATAMNRFNAAVPEPEGSSDTTE